MIIKVKNKIASEWGLSRLIAAHLRTQDFCVVMFYMDSLFHSWPFKNLKDVSDIIEGKPISEIRYKFAFVSKFLFCSETGELPC